MRGAYLLCAYPTHARPQLHRAAGGLDRKPQVQAGLPLGGKPAIIPSIGGWARQTGINTIFIDERDPYAHGFVVK